MICRNCGTTIADKAIVCFRCGTPTDIPVVTRKPGSSKVQPRWVSLLLAVLLAGSAVTLLTKTPPDAVSQWLGWISVVLAVFCVLGWLFLRPPSNRSRPV